MDAEFKNKKEVVFDGKDLIFNVDGIEIRNGKLPDSFSIKERYEISAESLTKLVVALGDGNTLAEFIDVQEGFSFSRKTRAIYSLKDEYVKKLVEAYLFVSIGKLFICRNFTATRLTDIDNHIINLILIPVMCNIVFGLLLFCLDI